MSAPLKLLYIDDDEALGRLVARQLGRLGFSVTLATSGAEGLSALGKDQFCCVALDHFMRGEVGLDVLGEIMRLPQPPPVIYVTGADEGRIAVSALKAGAVDYVIKDVGGSFVDLLREAVHQAIEQERLRRAREAAERAVREARERAEILLREVNHRVANSLQLVASMVSMQQKSGDLDPVARNVLVETQNRIHAIAQVHRRLYTSDDVRFVDMDAYLRGLADELAMAMEAAGRRHAIVLQARPTRVSTDRAVALGIIVSELVTNAFKYAYPPGASGEIRISLSAQQGTATLVVEDDGSGWSGEGDPQGSGLGSRIVGAMANTMRASLTYDDRPAGTRAQLVFPLDM